MAKLEAADIAKMLALSPPAEFTGAKYFTTMNSEPFEISTTAKTIIVQWLFGKATRPDN